MHRAAQFALGFAQSIMGLFAAGTVIYEAHQLFLWYYAREWQGIQVSGVNGCVGEEMVANGDLFSGETICHRPENLIPWIEIYRHHPLAAAAYYGCIVAVLAAVGIAWGLLQRRQKAPDLGNQMPHGRRADADTI